VNGFTAAQNDLVRSPRTPTLLERLSWAGISGAATALVVSCFLPAFELRIEAFIGAGSAQRGFDYEGTYSIVPDLLPFGLLPLTAGVALVVIGALGILRGSRPWLVVPAFALALGLALLVFDTEDKRLQWTGSGGVIGYEHDNGGPLLSPGLDDLFAAARRSPEAREPGWELVGGKYGYSSRGRSGWRVFLWSTLTLLWLTGYRLARLRFRPWASLTIVVAVTVVTCLWLVLRALSGLS
jgi:hypothetical protein